MIDQLPFIKPQEEEKFEQLELIIDDFYPYEDKEEEKPPSIIVMDLFQSDD